MKTPVVLLMFNRPDVTEKVFAAIRQARPEKLFIVADGPRDSKPGEREKCDLAREVVSTIDWPCDVKRDYADRNMGLRHRIPAGLTWVFNQVDRAIILEDDCLPHPSFFRFCEDLLEHYKDDERVLHIGAANSYKPREAPRPGEASYYFSRYPQEWGWATWSRAWALYDDSMTQWPAMRIDPEFASFIGDKAALRFWVKLLDMVKRENFNTWGYRWLYSVWTRRAISITSRSNLVSNIGFGPEATHTTQTDSESENLPVHAMEFPLRHPPAYSRDVEIDRYLDFHEYGIRSLPGRIALKISRILGLQG